MTRYVYTPLFNQLRDCLNQGLTQLGHTLGQATSYTIVEFGLMPWEKSDPIWTALSFTALSVIALENKIDGMAGREIDELDFLSDQVRQNCTNEAAVASALENTEERQAFLADLAMVRAALKIQ